MRALKELSCRHKNGWNEVGTAQESQNDFWDFLRWLSIVTPTPKKEFKDT